MQRNRSYVFFRLEEAFDPAQGPIGGAGVALDAAALDRGRPLDLVLRDAVLDRGASCPGESEAPEPFRRLMIAQDTGSAILGAARADIFFGGGDAAGARAGAIRHRARFRGAAAARRRAVKEAAERPRRVRDCAASARRRSRCGSRSPRASRAGAARALPTPSSPKPAAPPRRRRPRRAPRRRPRSAAQAAGPAAARAAGAPAETRSRARARRRSTARIDLHGMNQAEAHHALRGFLVHAQSQGAKLVIVVTGKGGGPRRVDVLDRRTRRAAPPRAALAARGGHARGRARLRGGGPRPRRRRRALCATAPPRAAMRRAWIRAAAVGAEAGD